MVKQSGLIHRQLIRGKSVTTGSIKVTPISRRISLGLPEWIRPDKGLVFISQRPAALIVKRGENTQTMRIRDVHQIIIFTSLLLTALSLYIVTRVDQKEKSQ